ncbi:MAG TPA: hypothetical protein VHA82_14980 [Ramlibacter sp.]|uniref:hypothetical protein n=1 Tax=Ramlibacter sp. TaxID=1917967 RepID=UPI002BC459C1|nr:hypothetical protein [Ramlibacter sp.]HVZ45112.1 hypothetical protein [Ramlibacter sp.]
MKTKYIAALLSCTAACTAWAHEGHGAPPFHWHATDTAGFVLVMVLAAIAVWLASGK